MGAMTLGNGVRRFEVISLVDGAEVLCEGIRAREGAIAFCKSDKMRPTN